ncbi:unnamed protein product [Spirodela intermedia]|nr:unnamed protein product [Spirodela intermedia]CAA6673544.1 unnamed protein product [Spirodela intermedia]
MERKRAARPPRSAAAEGLTEAAITVFRSLSSVMSQGPRRAPAGEKRGWLPEKMKKRTAEDVSLLGLDGRPRREDDTAGLEAVEEAQRQLHRLEVGFQGLEAGLEAAFRRLVQHRVLLLNILSQ